MTDTALIDDPAWVRERYVEAKELLAEVRDIHPEWWSLPAELREQIDAFYSETFMDARSARTAHATEGNGDC